MWLVVKIYLIFCIVVLIACAFGVIGSNKNFSIRMDLISAIGEYKRKCIYNNDIDKFFAVDFDDIHWFNMIQDCFPWLWKHEKHLPPEKYEIIKPYLKK